MTGSNNENCENKSTVARRRWKILAEALQRTSARDASPDSASTRKFQSFGLLSFDSLGQDFYSVRCINWDLKVTVRLLRRDFSPTQLTGFNNTGNVCIWPSEEILTYYCLDNLSIFSGKSVLELGGGMTCLAGMLVAASGEPSKMVLTDGNALSVNNVKVSLQRNYLPMETYTRVLRWGVPDEVSPHQGKFDVAMCADCLFFDEGRESLLSTLLKVLRPGGTALVVAPSRSGTFQTFASMCRPHFMVAVVEKYDQVVDQHVQKQTTMDPYYNKNLHFPLLMILKKKIGTN
ncbi:calmodulin-lysine N-methyltransferase-like isoform X1 [Homarus americanus]|uniref:calmodulin-lysine N-methyltransferase-like isoform X1 n=1 Tax=Homarus americanus TaxID=6706 RepID=UPI001C4900F6|nr:calmodulin-lysine N-methyltransferase-like isoform X1 [Homarus americanus]